MNFILFHDAIHGKYVSSSHVLTIVIVSITFLIILISFWIYKTFRLTEQGALKTEFASMITHELKTPLSPILNACEMLNDELIGKLNPSQKEEMERIHRNALSLLQIIIDILDAQKLDMGKLVFSNSEFNISDLFNELKSDNTKIISEKNVKFVSEIKDDVLMYSDKNRIHQIFNNLIKNSLDFVKDDVGMITIGSYPEKDYVVFFVKDNGLCIEMSKQSNLFKKFYQVDTSLKRKHGGTGFRFDCL